MDGLQKELDKLEKAASLQTSVDDVDKVLQQLLEARANIAADPAATAITLAKLQNPVKKGIDTITDDLKKVYSAQTKYGKALDKNLSGKGIGRSTSLAFEFDPLASDGRLTNRAIAMHLLREGHFDVVEKFLAEADIAPLGSNHLPSEFRTMYTILEQIRSHDLRDALKWARMHTRDLRQRDSDLEFDLDVLQYVWIFQGPAVNGMPDDEFNGLYGAMRYGRENFGRYMTRYPAKVQRLSAGVAFGLNIGGSPYRPDFNIEQAFEDVGYEFRAEFCSLMGLSAESPLYVAVTAGSISLPTLEKLATIMKDKRTEWTTSHELPVELPLPERMTYHQIFVCPVSKEQATADNPPMRLPCGHVLAKESLMKVSKGGKFKCPYCPCESVPSQSRRIIL